MHTVYCYHLVSLICIFLIAILLNKKLLILIRYLTCTSTRGKQLNHYLLLVFSYSLFLVVYSLVITFFYSNFSDFLLPLMNVYNEFIFVLFFACDRAFSVSCVSRAVDLIALMGWIIELNWIGIDQIVSTVPECIAASDLFYFSDVTRKRGPGGGAWEKMASLRCRRDPCGVICLILTYFSVFYADYVVIQYVLIPAYTERSVCYILTTFKTL